MPPWNGTPPEVMVVPVMRAVALAASAKSTPVTSSLNPIRIARASPGMAVPGK
jgi:hypothetical protein